MKFDQFRLSKEEYKKTMKRMPSKKCLLCGKKHYVLGFYIPHGPSDFAKENRHLKIPYLLCFECFLDAERSSKRVEAMIRQALEDCKKTA